MTKQKIITYGGGSNENCIYKVRIDNKSTIMLQDPNFIVDDDYIINVIDGIENIKLFNELPESKINDILRKIRDWLEAEFLFSRSIFSGDDILMIDTPSFSIGIVYNKKSFSPNIITRNKSIKDDINLKDNNMSEITIMEGEQILEKILDSIKNLNTYIDGI